MMNRLVSGLIALCCFGIGLLGADSPFTGTWKLDVAKSKFAKGHEYRELTVTLRDDGGSLLVGVQGMDGAGKPISTKYVLPAGGGQASYTEGAPPAGTITVAKWTDPRTISSVTTLNGKETGTNRTVANADGKTFTQTRTFTDATGKSSKSVLHYERQ